MSPCNGVVKAELLLVDGHYGHNFPTACLNQGGNFSENVTQPNVSFQAWDYSFETENGIKQEARGEMRRVEDVDVIVMRGSYSYPGMFGTNVGPRLRESVC